MSFLLRFLQCLFFVSGCKLDSVLARLPAARSPDSGIPEVLEGSPPGLGWDSGQYSVVAPSSHSPNPQQKILWFCSFSLSEILLPLKQPVEEDITKGKRKVCSYCKGLHLLCMVAVDYFIRMSSHLSSLAIP
ncbi:hypothetical protein CEXT_661241 [Caerostris extrusa]|uniref:Secreted protein n=1 Tax=Caerostris extrusa TaxID=172846 RepID=A0AAV4XRX8_CAEEX|nr:hypothetical protein CEXT_661241 [Caerostris extrusa]